jgi:transposase InsO family protein
MMDAPAPENKTQVKSFLGLVQYYAKFLPSLSEVATPIRQLLRDDVRFEWSSDCETAFREIKSMLVKPPILAFYDATSPLMLRCDASASAIGCVLSTIVDGIEKPIYYAHRSLSSAESRYAQIDREALSIVWGVTKMHKFLFGRQFTLVTDHRPLTYIFGEKSHLPTVVSSRLSRWAVLLAQYQYNIVYKRGSTHSNADYFSRLPAPSHPNRIDPAAQFYIGQINSVPAVTAAEIASETSLDPLLSRVFQAVQNGWKEHCPDSSMLPFYRKRRELSLQDGCILWGSRVCVPASLHSRVLDEIHSSHPGMVRMKSISRLHCYWPSIDLDIERRVVSCQPCQAFQNSPPRKEVISWPSTSRCWERIHLDYAPRFHGKALLILVDSYSRWVEIGVTSPNQTSSEATISLLENWFSRYGYPETVVSDNGSCFVSSRFQEYLKSIGARQKLSAPGYPATNGAAERCVQSVKKSLSKIMASQSSRNVEQALSGWLLKYRSTPHTCTGKTPAEMFLGRPVRTRISLMKPGQHASGEKHIFPKPALAIGNQVYFRDFSRNTHPWSPGVVTKVLGPRHFMIQSSGEDRLVHRRHLNQIRPILSR